MRFVETELAGAYVLEPEPIEDDRGFFARAWCRHEMEEHGLCSRVEQCNVSYNTRRGTLRGMHYQVAPHAEVKLVRCTMGALYDVIVDLRPDSPTFRRWVGVELTNLNRKMLYIPEQFAHGFITLEDETEVFYQISEVYHPECARGLLWNDPLLDIRWPLAPTCISGRDQAFPLLDEAPAA